MTSPGTVEDLSADFSTVKLPGVSTSVVVSHLPGSHVPLPPGTTVFFTSAGVTTSALTFIR